MGSGTPPVINYSSSMAYYSGSLYLFGGTTVELTSDDRLFKYEVTTKTWSVVAASNSPKMRYIHGTMLTGTKFYVFPGWNDDLQADVGTFHVLDLASPTKWELVATHDSADLSTRDSYSYASSGSKAYLFAGWSEVQGIRNDVIEVDFSKA